MLMAGGNGEEITMKSLGRIISSTLLLSFAALPALALDYEAKPVSWVLLAPFRAGGAVAGAIGGGVSGSADHSFHDNVKYTKRMAGQFGDEKGTAQTAMGEATLGPVGGVVGAVVGVPKGAIHGAKIGWKKPMSRWSFITMEEK